LTFLLIYGYNFYTTDGLNKQYTFIIKNRMQTV